MEHRKPSKVIKKDRYGNSITMEYAPDSKPLDPTALAKHAMDQNMEVPEITMMSAEPDHPGGPQGSDTVPAWLTPGEFVVNAEAMRMPGVKEQVEGINNQGRAMQQMQGGSIPSAGGYNQGGQIPFLAAPRMNLPQYQDAGGFIGDLLAGGLLQNVFNQAPEQPPIYSHAAEVIARKKAEEIARQQAQHKDDGGWITDALLDKLREVESGGDNEAVSCGQTDSN